MGRKVIKFVIKYETNDKISFKNTMHALCITKQSNLFFLFIATFQFVYQILLQIFRRKKNINMFFENLKIFFH